MQQCIIDPTPRREHDMPQVVDLLCSPEATRSYISLNGSIRTQVAAGMSAHQCQPSSAGFFAHQTGFSYGPARWQLNKHVKASLESFKGLHGMEVRWRSDNGGIDPT
jgi:hypothetical protein